MFDSFLKTVISTESIIIRKCEINIYKFKHKRKYYETKERKTLCHHLSLEFNVGCIENISVT